MHVSETVPSDMTWQCLVENLEGFNCHMLTTVGIPASSEITSDTLPTIIGKFLSRMTASLY